MPYCPAIKEDCSHFKSKEGKCAKGSPKVIETAGKKWCSGHYSHAEIKDMGKFYEMTN